MTRLAFSLLIYTAILTMGCSKDKHTLTSVPIDRDLPREFLDIGRFNNPSIVYEIPQYLLNELIYLGWDEHSPVYHKFLPNGNLVISLSPSLFIGTFGPLQRTIRFDDAEQGRDSTLIDLLHRLSSLGDSTATVLR